MTRRTYRRSVAAGIVLSCATSAAMCLDPVGSCTGDLNGDRRVDSLDLTTLLANYGKEPARWVEGDVNDDGRVDGGDLIVVVQTYGCREF